LSALASERGGMATVKRQTGLVSGDLGDGMSWDREQSATRSMPIVFSIKIAICLIFATATLACHFTSSRHMCTGMPPLLFKACTRGWGLVAQF